MGAIQLKALQLHEARVGKLCNYYDLVVGTSVGSIHASAIASGKISIKEVADLYPSWLKQIFKKSWWPLQVPKYNRTNFINIWLDKFGMMKMKDCQTKLMITSVDLCEDRNHYFKSWEKDDGDEWLVTVICRSFSAPFYFGSLVDVANKKVWSDGGVGLSNISLNSTLIESLLLGWLQNEEILIDAFGSGYVDDSVPFDIAKKEGFVSQILDYMKPADGGMAREQSRLDQVLGVQKIAQTLKNIKFNYWDVQIDKKDKGMDKIELVNKYFDYGMTMGQKPLISV